MAKNSIKTEIKSTVHQFLNINIDDDDSNPGRYRLTVGVLHSKPGQRHVKSKNQALLDIPFENLSYFDAKLYQKQFQEWIDKQNKGKTQWKAKKKRKK